MNEIANLCEIVGADIDMVRRGMGSDARIGSKFLYAGAGYGGSCFPKDVRALYNVGKQNGYRMALIEAVEEVNERQKEVVFHKLKIMFDGDIKGKTIAIWGLSFKPETDDMREAPSLVVIDRLLSEGATIKVFDPIAMDETRRRIGDKVTYCNNIYEAALDADAVVLMTEWKQFRLPSWGVIKKSMNGNIVVDGRNIYDADEMLSEGFRYSRIGKKIE
ncbi:MAG: nucleotide sugar dehydrogenase, partial [Rikenellaceae bacterium]